MAISPRLIRRRIKSVTNTRKITKAMELVAAAKMRRAMQATLASRPYAEAAWRAIKEIARIGDPSLHPLLAECTSRGACTGRKLAVVITSDRGLCGGFNAQLLRAYNVFMRQQPTPPEIAAIGKKGQDALRRTGGNMVAAFTGLGDSPSIAQVRAVADLAIGDFTAGKYDEVWLAYTDYRSALVQTPQVKRLLPITHIEGLGDVTQAAHEGKSEHSGGEALKVGATGTPAEYLFEPSPDAVLDTMLPRLVEAQIRQALLESAASEHAARMMAMRSATDAASEMIDDLTLTYNQARQAGITREIAEISSGKAALES